MLAWAEQNYIDLAEAAAVSIAVLLALTRPGLGASWFARIETAFARLADRPWTAAALVMLAAGGLRLAFLEQMPFPGARSVDEYSLMLQVDTYLEGRLANPTHPFARHFETPYVHQEPAYGSMYFPGRSLAMLAGVALFGEAGIGVWLTMLLAAGLSVWMLRGWVSPGLSLLGGALFAAKYAIFSVWANTLFGVEIAVLGGVLVLGAFPRLRRRIALRDAALLATGAFLLATSRPFEGLLFCLPFAAVLCCLLFDSLHGADWRGAAGLAVAPAIAIGAALALNLAYNQANTGDPLRTPYQVNRAVYAGTPAFLFLDEVPITRPVPRIVERYYEQEGAAFEERRRTAIGFVELLGLKAWNVFNLFIGFALLLPALIGVLALRRHAAVAWALGLVSLGFGATAFGWAHYLAPIAGVFLLCVVLGLDALRRLNGAVARAGLFLSRALPSIVFLSLLVPIASLAFGWPPALNRFGFACCALHWRSERAVVEALLAATPGRDLVLLRHDLESSVWRQWVYNGADIDAAEIIWAHDLGEEANARLMAYYPERRVWLVEVARDPEMRAPLLLRAPGG